MLTDDDGLDSRGAAADEDAEMEADSFTPGVPGAGARRNAVCLLRAGE